MSKARLLYIDQARGLCMIFVIIGHVYALDNPFFSLIYGTNVTLFFMLSGYVRGLSSNDMCLSAVVKGNIRKILVPYVFYSFFIFAWQLIRYYVFGFGSVLELKSNVVDILTLYGISSMWFLSTLFVSKTIFAAAVNLIREKKWIYFLLCVVIFAMVIVCLNLLPYLEVQTGMANKILKRIIRIFTRSLQALAFMIYGLLLCKLEIKQKKKKWYLPVCIVSFVLAVMGFSVNGITDFNTLQFANVFLYNICPILILPGILLLCRQLKVREILCVIGEYSLMIMATHLVFLSLAQIICYYITAKTGIAAIYWTNGWFVFVIVLEFVLILIREKISKHHQKG